MKPVASLDARTNDARTIALVGLMGAGKTCVGRRLAGRIGLPFVDADEELVRAAGTSIPEIFRTHGEAAFRDAERRVIARLLAGPPQVLATGGGAFIDPQTRQLIRESAISVWLRADLDLLARRTIGRGGRPLLETADPRATLAALMAARDPVYAEADVVVDSSDEPKEVTAARVARALEAFRAGARYGGGGATVAGTRAGTRTGG